MVGTSPPLQLFDVKGAYIQDGHLIVGKPTAFVIYFKNGKTLYFTSATMEQKEKWIRILSGKANPPEPSSPRSYVETRPLSDGQSFSGARSPSQGSKSLSRAASGASLENPPQYTEMDRRPVLQNSEVLPILEYLESFTDAVVIGDSNGNVVATNKAADQMFGWSKGELEGLPLTALMPEPYKSHHDAYIFRHEKFGQSNLLGKVRNLKAEKKNGESFDVQISLGKVPGTSSFIATLRELGGDE